jgi:hypothetical protein
MPIGTVSNNYNPLTFTQRVFHSQIFKLAY